jgi:hypothetical protein
MMERADNDDRLDKLASKVASTSNQNMKKLLELQVGHLRNTTRNSLYESDYYLIYTDRAERFDNITRDVEDCLEYVLNGSYNGYYELDKRETIEVHKELIGVSYFDYNSATVNTFREFQIDDTPAVTIKRINLASGSVVDISKSDDALLRKIAKEIDYGNSTDINVMKMLAQSKNNDYRLRSGIDLDKVSQTKIDTNIVKDALRNKKRPRKGVNKATNLASNDADDSLLENPIEDDTLDTDNKSSDIDYDKLLDNLDDNDDEEITL